MERNISLKGFTTLILGLAAAALILPFIIPKITWLENYFPQHSSFVNYFEGIATPILYLLTSILLFFSFREQEMGNRLTKIQFENNEKRELRRLFLEEISNFEKYLDKFGNKKGESSGTVIKIMFNDYITAVNNQERELYLKNPELHLKQNHIDLYFILKEFDRLFINFCFIEYEDVKKEIKQKMHLLFEFYFHGVITLTNFKSMSNLETDFIFKQHKKLLYWENELKTN